MGWRPTHMHKLICAGLVCLFGCARLAGFSDNKDQPPIKSYNDGREGLAAFFGDVVTAARRDERERVHQLLASTMMTDAEFRGLFAAKAELLLPRYHALMGTLVNRGAVELVAQIYERKYDAVEVWRIEPTNATGDDKRVRGALAQPVPIYSVRVKKNGESKGLRYDFFLYLNQHWVTGNQLGKFIDGGPRDGGT